MPTFIRGWKCDSCGEIDQNGRPWNCPGCDEEVCENCFDSFAHCEMCAAVKTDEELRLAANAAGWNFEAIGGSVPETVQFGE